ncbi:MAG: PAS domain-containing protein [Hyphomicrobiaceae bacterium]
MDRNKLKDGLNRYRFADTAIRKHFEAMLPTDRAMLEAERAEAFSRLLETTSGEPAIAVVQLRALVHCLANSGLDRELTTRLVTMAERHLDELGHALHRRTPPPHPPLDDGNGWLSDAGLRALNADVNRVAIIGSDYRYLYSNPANATFHGAPPTSLVGKPLWETTSAEFFANVSKPVFDRCFAGHHAAFVSHHPGRDVSQVFSAHLSPILDRQGKTIAALGTMRLVDYPSSPSSLPTSG